MKRYIIISRLFRWLIVTLLLATLAAPSLPAAAQTGPSGSLFAWGANGVGQVGIGTDDPFYSTPQVVVFFPTVGAIAAGGFYNLAVNSFDGGVWAWGANSFGQLGTGTTQTEPKPVQVRGPGGTGVLNGVTGVAAGSAHSLALKPDGTVWAWGINDFGELGNGASGSGQQSTTPVQVKGPGGDGFLSDVVALAAGEIHSLALKSDGTVWAWGGNLLGQLGDNTIDTRTTPVQVVGPTPGTILSGIVAIAAASFHSLALRSDGAVYAWGYNDFGQLGDGTRQSSAFPVRVSNLTDVVAIAAGGVNFPPVIVTHSMAVKSDGTVWAWGDNRAGQLGVDPAGMTTCDVGQPVDVACSLTPVQAGGLTGVSAVAAGAVHSLALKSDGTVWSWGYNADGELGNGTTNDQPNPSPAQVQNLPRIAAIAGGVFHSLVSAPPPSVTLNPTSLDFGQRSVDSTSPAQTVTVTNSGGSGLLVSSISITGATGANPTDFAVASDTCSGTTVGAQGSCTIGVTFTPTAIGPRSANLVITDNAAGSPRTVSLTGFGLSADLRVNIAARNTVRTGDNLAYDITVSNGGPTQALDVQLRDSFPTGTTFVSVAASQGSCVAVPPNQPAQLNCSLGDLAAGASVKVMLIVNVTAPGGSAIMNTVNVKSDIFDPNLANNEATATTRVVGRRN